MTILESSPRLRCHFCQSEISEDKWFARVLIGNQRAVFCRPRCVELFYVLRGKQSSTEANSITGAAEENQLRWAPDFSVQALFPPAKLAYAN